MLLVYQSALCISLTTLHSIRVLDIYLCTLGSCIHVVNNDEFWSSTPPLPPSPPWWRLTTTRLTRRAILRLRAKSLFRLISVSPHMHMMPCFRHETITYYSDRDALPSIDKWQLILLFFYYVDAVGGC